MVKIILCGVAIFVIFLVTWVLPAKAQDYCNATLCNSGRKHIGCNNNGAFSSNCQSNPRVITMTQARIDRIVNDHNRKRNELAGGKLPNYLPAKRMASMQWSPELAKLAVLNVKQCAMKHDECRNTRNFPLAGQNLAFASWAGLTRTEEEVIDQHINMWWNEYNSCSMTYINNFRAPPAGSKQIGHFTQMAQERANFVGCGSLRQEIGARTYQYTACNYAITNMVNRPVYRSGNTASLCEKGTNIYYNNLCKISEYYNVKTGNY